MLTRFACRAALRPAVGIRAFSSSKATFALEPVRAHLCDGPPAETEATKEEMLAYFHEMALCRRTEIAADNAYKQRLIRGFCHLYDGQEALSTGMEAAITQQDHIITAYRCHAAQLTREAKRGVDTPTTLKGVFAELMGRVGGIANGKGGSMHFYDPEGNFYGGNGIVGAQVPVGTGVAFASKYKKDGTVCLSLYGDGAANQGQIFEAANMAQLWKLPAIFVCENNQYGMGTSQARASASQDFHNRLDFVPGLQCDGMDVLAVREAVKYARQWCRDEKGPMFLEFKTYRYHGHSMSDPGISYRSREEVSQVRKEQDCIEKVRGRLIDEGWATKAELKAIEKEIRTQVNEAVEWAKAQPEPPMSEQFADIYEGAPPPYVRACNIDESVRASA